MDTFQFSRPTTMTRPSSWGNLADSAAVRRSSFRCGGTTLIDLMKLNVERPKQIVDINILPLDKIQPAPDGGLIIEHSHATPMSPITPQCSASTLCSRKLSLRRIAPASQHGHHRRKSIAAHPLRLLPRHCTRLQQARARHRLPAIDGQNRTLAILGTSKDCIATNPSDQNVALTALEATIQVQGTKGKRSIPIHEFYLLPGSTPIAKPSWSRAM